MEAQCGRKAMQLHAAASEKPVFRAKGEPGNRERLYSQTDVGGKLVARRTANLGSLDCRWTRKITKVFDPARAAGAKALFGRHLRKEGDYALKTGVQVARQG